MLRGIYIYIYMSMKFPNMLIKIAKESRPGSVLFHDEFPRSTQRLCEGGTPAVGISPPTNGGSGGLDLNDAKHGKSTIYR